MFQAKHRQANFEILRVMAMFLIVVCHFYTHGIFKETITYQPVSEHLFATGSLLANINYLFSEYIHEISCIAVNCYVLISGYFMVSKPFRINRIVKLWVEVFFYSMLITLLLMFLGMIPLGIKQIIKSLFPLAFNQYWFITNYVGLLILSPLLNVFITHVNDNFYTRSLILIGLISFTFIEVFPWGNTFGGQNSLLWFVYLYLIAGYIQKYGAIIGSRKMSGKWFFVSSLFVFVYAMIYELCYAIIGNHGLYAFNFTYNGFTFFVSLFAFLWFKTHRFSNKFIIHSALAIAPYTLAVYLISDHSYFRAILWHYIIKDNCLIEKIYFIPYMLIVCFAIFLLCIGVDILRKSLFKWIHINTLIERVSLILHSTYNRFLKVIYEDKLATTPEE